MAHMTVAASEGLFRDLFAALRDNFSFSDSNSGSFGPFSAGYNIACHLEGGTVDLRNDGTVAVKELDVKWNTFAFNLGFDIPEICVGGWCILGIPFDGCAVRLPRWCLFSGNPDVNVTLDLSGIITSEISFVGALVTRYFTDPARAAWMSDLDAEDANVPNKWQVFVDPETVDLDLFDIADIVGDLLESAVEAVVDGLLGFLPGWVRDIVKAILGPIIDLIRAILDLPDDIAEWLSDLLNTSLGLMNSILTFVADYFAAQSPICQFEDPFPILPASGGLIPVKLPIRDLSVTVSDVEMTLEANIGN